MKKIFKLSALLLALLTLLSLFAACGDEKVTLGCSPSKDEDPSESQESLPESGTSIPVKPSPSRPQPSSDEESQSKNENQLAVNKDNALEKLKAGYAATMGASALSLTGEASHYEAGKGKGDTLVYPISYKMKNTDGAFEAFLSYGVSNGSNEYYFTAEKTYAKEYNDETEGYVVTGTVAKEAPTVENTVMPVLNEQLGIASFENVFTRFCQTDYDIEYKDGVYTLYFYGSYTEFARICLEDTMYESLLKQKVDEQFPTNKGSVEFYLTEDGYFAGMSVGSELTSETRSMKSNISYTFAEFSQNVSVSAPAWIAEAK